MITTLIVRGPDGGDPPPWQRRLASTVPGALMIEPAEGLRLDGSRSAIQQCEMELAGALFHHPGAVLVGHGIGALVIARVMTAWPQIQAGGALLVSPADGRAVGIGQIHERPLGVPAVVSASEGDADGAFDRARRLAEIWRARFVDMGSGAANASAGFASWATVRSLRNHLADEGRDKPLDDRRILP